MRVLEYMTERVAQLKRDGLYREAAVLNGPQAARATINGCEVVNLASNNYLGLATHPRLKRAAALAVASLGVGSGAVRTIIGTQEGHLALERELATFKGAEAALAFPSGFATNAGVIPALAEEGDLVFSDALNHASIIDGCRLGRARVIRFRHADVGHLEALLRAERHTGAHATVITDGVFSMDGDVAPLPDLVTVAHRYDAAVYVDDAHGSGVMGPNGHGTAAHFGLAAEVDIQVGTLSKAIGVLGGYVATDRSFVTYLTQRARPFLFSTSMPPAVVAACREALRVMDEEPERHDRLWANTRRFKQGLAAAGFDIGRSETPITPVMVGDEAKAMALSDRLLAHGVFAQGIVYPTVARGAARVRTIVTAEHSDADLDQALDAFARAGRETGLLSAGGA
jgi:glycine C-acetyltransferase